MSPKPFPFSVHRDSLRVSLRFHGRELSDELIDEIGEELTRIAEECKSGHLQLDLGEVDYLSSAALGKIVGMHKRLIRGGGRLSIKNVKDFPYEVFCVTRLDSILDIHRKSSARESIPA